MKLALCNPGEFGESGALRRKGLRGAANWPDISSCFGGRGNGLGDVGETFFLVSRGREPFVIIPESRKCPVTCVQENEISFVSLADVNHKYDCF